MGLTAEFRLQSPRLPLIDVASAVPDLTFRLESTDQPQSGPVVFFIRVTGSSFDGVDAALTDSPSVKEHVRISEIGSIRIYQVVLTGPRPEYLDKRMFYKTFPESITIASDGWYIKQQLADRNELLAYQEFWQTRGFSFRLDRLYDSHSTDTELIGISEKQREALLTAYEAGYFAVPQQTSLDNVATALKISRSALAERLHRAQAHLIEHFYYTDLY
ncbi:helix-turn-helix domain-containing protein [Halocatena marina]|uniref:helix-turn-helix domain-containing protein n=1 Tax=Halocatena marina TaxID=2934937 RepID=UPI00200BBC9B|nr:helix-turn-helix domain-containing protein [Halocatena marina]